MADLLAYDGANTLAFVILAFVFGILLACCGMLYQIKVPGRVVRALLAAGALSEQTAVGADTFGMKSEWLLRFLLKDTGALAKYVRVCPVRQIKRRGRDVPVLADARFYLAPETKDRAAIRYDRRRASVGALIAAIILFSALGVILLTVIPDLIQMCKNFISIVKGE